MPEIVSESSFGNIDDGSLAIGENSSFVFCLDAHLSTHH